MAITQGDHTIDVPDSGPVYWLLLCRAPLIFCPGAKTLTAPPKLEFAHLTLGFAGPALAPTVITWSWWLKQSGGTSLARFIAVLPAAFFRQKK